MLNIKDTIRFGVSRMARGTNMRPTKQVTWYKGVRATLKTLGAKQSDQHSPIARLGDSYVFTAEIDHVNRKRNRYDHMEGTFHKRVIPHADGKSPLAMKHAEELYAAASTALEAQLKCRLLLVKGAKHGTTRDGVKAAVDADDWQVTKLSGSVASGFSFSLERVE
jgi:hypothetical protein